MKEKLCPEDKRLVEKCAASIRLRIEEYVKNVPFELIQSGTGFNSEDVVNILRNSIRKAYRDGIVDEKESLVRGIEESKDDLPGDMSYELYEACSEMSITELSNFMRAQYQAFKEQIVEYILGDGHEERDEAEDSSSFN